ncbi:hypothetical protein V1520DRAFT_284324 [Lipomyces starkeyi]|uniref:Uncharacterized protein n=1 Tax=Lipomyces starkeyi NRRL Y-11557 TaxID=675824 RepID=A0A1E3Q038_LIPST|nr:hypothetical protein LIPSTDRAFT_5743 [Lipomyces starkeyi NRRL Y-11557]
MSLLHNDRLDCRSYASARRAACAIGGSAVTLPATKQRGDIRAKARARKTSAKDEAMDGELSKALETFHRPMPSDSMLQFTVTEDGYKKIVEERDSCNRKYRVWYDGYSFTVTIICCPSDLHNMAAVTVVDSLVAEAVRVLRTAGISDDVISRIKKPGNETSASRSRTRSYREPDGAVLFEDRTSPRIHRIVLEVGFSQNYIPLQRATMWWIEEKISPVAILLCLTERHKSSGATRRVFRSEEDMDAEMEKYIEAFDRQQRQGNHALGPLVYDGYSWFGTLQQAFFETWRRTDTGMVKNGPLYLVNDGLDVSVATPLDLGDFTLGDIVPSNAGIGDVMRSSALNFVRPQTYIQVLSDAIFRTALNRVAETFEVEEHP